MLVRASLTLAESPVWLSLVLTVLTFFVVEFDFLIQLIGDNSGWFIVYGIFMMITLIQFMFFGNYWYQLIIATGRKILASNKIRQRRRRRRLSGLYKKIINYLCNGNILVYIKESNSD